MGKVLQIMDKYCADVLSDKILSCVWVKKAVTRHLNDLKNGKFTFDEDAARKPLKFISRLTLIEGEWRGQRLKLEPWQVFIIASIFGWKRENGTRRYNRATVIVPRKNAKSTLAAAIGLYLLYEDGEGAPQIYTAATKLKQAKIVFNIAAEMVKYEPRLMLVSSVSQSTNHSRISYDGGIFRPMEWNPDTDDGLNPHGAIIDEYHAHKNDDLVDVLDTGMGSRKQPLMAIITTEGFGGEESPHAKNRKYGEDVLNGLVEDDSEFFIIFTMDKDDDWRSLEARKKANPNWGVSVYAQYLNDRVKKASMSNDKERQYKTKHLNIAVDAPDVWIEAEQIKKDQVAFNEDDLVGEQCFIGLDLAMVKDFTSFVLKFPRPDGTYCNIYRHYLPEETFEKRSSREKMMFESWVADGYLTITPGNTTDYRTIKTDILACFDKYDVKLLAYDHWNSSYLISELLDELEDDELFIKQPQTIGQMSEPCKAVERDILACRNYHNNNPVICWQYSNAVLRKDDMENQKPDKKKSTNKIDGVVAEVMAKSAQMHWEMENKDEWFEPHRL